MGVPLTKGNAIRRSDSLLRRCVNIKRRRHTMGQLRNSNVLHNDGIDASSVANLNQVFHFSQF
jgi:hypothetical protein